MKETVQEYVQRIQGKLAGQDPLKVQSTTAKKLARLIKGATSAKLRKRPAPEKWSAAEILAHLADAEIVTSWRIRSILGAPGTSIQAFDQDAWFVAGHYPKRDARKSLELFRVLRETNLALYKMLAPEQWKHYGIHAERGEESIERIVGMMADTTSTTSNKSSASSPKRSKLSPKMIRLSASRVSLVERDFGVALEICTDRKGHPASRPAAE